MAISRDAVELATESVAAENIKVGAGYPMALLNAHLSQHLSHLNRVNVLAETALSQQIKGLLEVDPLEAVSVVKAMTGDDVAQQIMNKLAALGGGQQVAKVAQSTPPETAVPFTVQGPVSIKPAA